jgi:hypothetical protein
VIATLPPTSQDGRPLQWLNGIAVGADNVIYFTEDRAVRRLARNGAVSTWRPSG